MNSLGPALRYYGGKWRLANRLLSCFPAHECYVEPFGGSAGVLLRKQAAPVEVFNDRDGRCVNFWRALRERPQDLIRAVSRTPWSRAEFDSAFQVSHDCVEDARRYFVLGWQSFGGPRSVRRTGWKYQRALWIRRNKTHVGDWQRAARNLVLVAKRLREVQIECDDALKVISRYDGGSTFFYCDPPYPAQTRNRRFAEVGYSHEFTTDDHVHLANLLNRVVGSAAVSSYPNLLYDDLYGAAGWQRLEFQSQTMSRDMVTEVLWVKPCRT